MKKNKVLKATIIVMIMTIVSRGIGFMRDILAAYHFGVGEKYDIYSAAVSIPESVFMIIGLAISTTFIPMLSEIKHKKSKEEMFGFSNKVITMLTIISLVLLSVGLVFTEDIVKIFVSGFGEEEIRATVALTRISLVNLVFLCLNSCFTSVLQVCEDFLIPSIVGLFFNVPIIIYLLLFNDVTVLGLTIANVVGNALRVLVQVPSLYKQGFRIKIDFDINDIRIKRMLILIVPVIVGAGANSINIIVDKNVASGLVAGSISALDYSQRIVTFINSAITTSIVAVVYPTMANSLNDGDKENFMKYLSKSIVIIALFLIPITSGLIVLRREIVGFFYSRGAFGLDAIALTSAAFFGYALQLPFLGVRDILNSSLFSMQKTKITTINGIIGVAFNVILSIVLSKYLGVAGISIATCISAAITSILLFNSTRKLIDDVDFKPMIREIIKILISSAVMFVVLKYINTFIWDKSYFVFIVIDTVIGSIIFVICCIALKIAEFNEAIIMIMEKFKRKRGA